MTDHGISHARGKQFLYEEGIHVPLIVAGPGVEEGQVRDDLVEHIDIAALSLGLAGIDIPDYMQAKNILSDQYEPRAAIYSARDRCDETVEHMRCVRTQEFKYIRNFLPNRPHMQPNRYKDQKSIIMTMRSLLKAKKLTDVQARIFQSKRPEEELYDLRNDPHEIRNLADDPAFNEQLLSMRGMLDSWIEETGDKGPESGAMYDSDMAVYVNSQRRSPDQIDVLERNIALMKRWQSRSK